MAEDLESSRGSRDAGDQLEQRGNGAFGIVQRVAHVVLPLLIILSVFLAYRARPTTVETEALPPTQAVSTAAQLVGDEAPGAAESGLADAGDGDGSDGPEGSEGREDGSTQGEFSSSGPAPAPEADPSDALAVSIEINWSLGSGGAVTSQAILPLNGFVQDVELRNYDSDRDDDPGLTVQIGTGLGEQDPSKRQRWLAEPGDASQLDGRPTLDLWVATKDFDIDKSGRVLAGLYHCSATGDDCELLSQGDAIFDQATFGDDFGRVTINMAPLSVSVAPERAIQIELTAAESSEADLWLAYGTADYRTFLSVR